jgi:hypothetical protein
VINNAIGQKNVPQIVQPAEVFATTRIEEEQAHFTGARIAFDVSDNRDISRLDNPRYISKNCAASCHQQPAAL